MNSRSWWGGVLLVCAAATAANAQQAAAPPESPPDTRTQYPALIANSYVGLNVGYLATPLSTEQLLPGFHASAVHLTHGALNVALFGHHFAGPIAVEMAYMRPFRFITYQNVNGSQASHSVWTAFAEFDVKGDVAIASRVSLAGRIGFGLTSRRGFETAGGQAIADALFPSLLAGGGLEYHVNAAWDLVTGLSYLAGSAAHEQPRTLFASGGVRYSVRPLPAAEVARAASSDIVFPEHMVQVGYATNAMGYGPNTFVSHAFPIFWGGRVNVGRGLTARYDQNVFHTRRWFALDFGVSASSWRSDVDAEPFFSLSAYPRARLMLIHASAADLCVSYAVAGPTYLSRVIVDGLPTGTNHFIFQDAISVSAFAGRNRHVLVGVSVTHFSNGNLASTNPGVTVPLTFDVGYAF
jgi:hypothetical protein